MKIVCCRVMDEKITIVRNGTARRQRLSSLEFYEGKENLVKVTTTYKATFTCIFYGAQQYPFDSEQCSFFIFITGTDNKKTDLVSSEPVEYNSSKSTVGEFTIFKLGVTNNGRGNLKVSKLSHY